MSLQQSPAGGGTVALLTGGLVVLVVGVFAAGGLLVRAAGPSSPSSAPSAIPAQPPATTTAPTAPAVTPSRNPRRQPDVDRGKPLDHGIFVEVADGWTVTMDYLGLRGQSWSRGAGVQIYVLSNPMPSRPLLRPDATSFAETQGIYGFRAGQVRALPLPNLNVVEAASISFTGRRHLDDATYSLSGECIRLRGAPEVNDVSLSICWAAYVQDLDTVRAEVQQMIASAAGSV